MSEEISASTVSAIIKSAETKLHQIQRADLPQQADGSTQSPFASLKTDRAQSYPDETSAATVTDPAKDEEVLFEVAASEAEAEAGTINGETASDHTGPAGISAMVEKPTVNIETPATATPYVDATPSNALSSSGEEASPPEPEGPGAPAVEEGLPCSASESTTLRKADEDILRPPEIATDEIKPPGSFDKRFTL